MERHGPWLYATLTKGENARHLLILFVNGSAATELILIEAGEERSLAMGTEYEMTQQAEAIARIWSEDEGFKRLGSEKFAFEQLGHAIVLAKRMGFTSVYDPRFKKTTWPKPNFTGEVSLSEWPGMTAKNGGNYRYAVDQMRLHARPTLPTAYGPIIAPTGGKEFAEFMLRLKATLDTVGPPEEFILGGNTW